MLQDPGTLYQFCIVNEDGAERPFLLLRLKDDEEAYDKLEDLSRDPSGAGARPGDQVAYRIVPDA